VHRPASFPVVALLVAVLAAGLLLALPAGAATTRTSFSPEQIRSYHRSGKWARDVAQVFRSARRSLRRQLEARRIRRPAIVLDIDETSLSNYSCLNEANFELSGLAVCVGTSRSVAIRPARTMVREARRRNVAVFFVTAAPENLVMLRRQNLREAGFRGTFTIIGRPTTDTNTETVVPFKSGARRSIERRGYRILVNVGDQRSDLAGGHARRTFKLPNRIYVTT
jgi:predicted secreted acid phosphatase